MLNNYRPFIVILILILIIGFIPACSGSNLGNNGPTPTKSIPPSVESIMAGINERSKGLTYISEIDSPVYVFFVMTNNSENLPENFLPALGLPEWTPYQIRSPFNTWIQISINRDPNWIPLRDYLNANLFDMQVYVIGEGPAKMIYATGYYSGCFIGIKMNATET